jgi:aspartyl-tRNA synthetase
MHAYRTHNCGELRASHVGQEVKLSGWIHRKRDLGNLRFVDLRDHYGITQCVVDSDCDVFSELNDVRAESVVTFIGEVISREGNINKNMPTGEIEITVKSMEVLSSSKVLPIQVAVEDDSPEELRLKYRFLDLRKEKLHKNMLLRSKVISDIRKDMIDEGFVEYQTPILTASSPEGARDFLVPSRLNKGKFYSLPQAPQQFKQLLMVSGFDRYFQIAPCFRDEDPRADRTPGEFYQLDFEMSFVTQDEIFETIEPVIYKMFKNNTDKYVSPAPFRRIKFADSMLKYGNDKPDLRNPLIIEDVTELFKGCEFGVFANKVEAGEVIRAIKAPKAGNKSRKFFDEYDGWAKKEGMGGAAYIAFADTAIKGIAKFLGDKKTQEIKSHLGLEDGDAVFFIAGKENKAAKFAGHVRNKLGEDLEIIDESKFEICWIVDYPFYEEAEEGVDAPNGVQFSHNPFSMPQGGMEVLENAKSQEDFLNILAYQYDCVCNGIELASGGIRNNRPDIMYKAFEIAGYDNSVVDNKFGGMINAFQYGAPPHGGAAFGIDRIVMMLADTPSIREVILFPMNGKAQDVMMQAPNVVDPQLLKDVGIKLDLSDKDKEK